MQIGSIRMSEQSFNTFSKDEISLRDIIDFLAESWKTIMLGGAVGGLLGLGYGFMMPSMYQVTANLQVAKVAGADVEAPALLVEKLKMPMYYSQKTYGACGVMESTDPGAIIANTLKPTLSKNTPIIYISYRSGSPEDAKKCLESVLDDIRFNQGRLVKPILESKKNQLANLKLKLESAEKILKILPKQNSQFDFTDLKFSSSALLLATTLSKESETLELRAAISDLEISLLEPQTIETFLSTSIYAPNQKVSPKRVMILVNGAMSGLFIGFFLMIAKRAHSAYKTSNQRQRSGSSTS